MGGTIHYLVVLVLPSSSTTHGTTVSQFFLNVLLI